MSEHGWRNASPILRVGNLRASVDYYVNVLDFKLDWQAGELASVSRDECCLFLCQGDQSGSPVWVWIGVADAGALHEQLRSKGATIRHPPTNYDWAYEMQVADPDGNVLRLGSDPKKGEPMGEWLDGSGRRWRPNGEGWRVVGG
jgi:catechol 2,3-dioxygenase-like lactoylglutathione lyase family enzyme